MCHKESSRFRILNIVEYVWICLTIFVPAPLHIKPIGPLCNVKYCAEKHTQRLTGRKTSRILGRVVLIHLHAIYLLLFLFEARAILHTAACSDALESTSLKVGMRGQCIRLILGQWVRFYVNLRWSCHFFAEPAVPFEDKSGTIVTYYDCPSITVASSGLSTSTRLVSSVQSAIVLKYVYHCLNGSTINSWVGPSWCMCCWKNLCRSNILTRPIPQGPNLFGLQDFNALSTLLFDRCWIQQEF